MAGKNPQTQESTDIGTFEVVKGELRLGDPNSSEGSILLDKVRRGRWLIIVNHIDHGPRAGQLESFVGLHMRCLEDDLEWGLDARPVSTQSQHLAAVEPDRHSLHTPAFDWSLWPHGFQHKTQLGPGHYDFGIATRKDLVVGIELFLNQVDDLD